MLSIYKASAGSGKTYTLTREYLRMLLLDKPLPDDKRLPHSRILAVTFTKKSTAEMKERILRELYILATKPNTSEYINDFLSDNNISLNIDQIQQRAQALLIGILQDYTRFSVSTIDGFFQQVIRSFAKELGLSATYDVSLDSEEIVQQAVDDLFKRIREQRQEDDNLRTWIIDFAHRNIDNDKQWNPSGLVKKFSTELLKENLMRRMHAIQEAFSDKDLMRHYQQLLTQICEQAEQDVNNLLQQALDIFASETGWTSNLVKAFAKTPINWLNGDIGNTFNKVLENPTSAYVKSIPKAQQQHLATIYEQQLAPIFLQLHQLCTGDTARNYHTAKAIIPNLYTMGILQDVNRQISETDLVLGRLPISKTNQIINQIIDGQDAPFIYERIGQYYRHYMIDEFQDTSALQWENFAPLIHETEGNNRDNLIVGDVKQSIYRFRNSDWHLLNAVSSQFQNVKLPKMDENWRTAEVVITENEKLLQRYSTWVADRIDEQTLQPDLSQDIRHMYSYGAMHQKAKKKYKGYFHMQFFEGKTAKVESLEALDQLLQSLLAEGIDLKRVTLLTRFAYEAAELAQFLIQRNYSVQSAAGLRVGSHPAVKTIIHILKEDFYTKHSIAQSAVQQFYGEINEEQIQQILQAKSLPLYERIQTIIDILHLQSTEGAVPYLTAFLDIVYQFTKSRIADANAFIEYWERKADKFTIPAAKTTNTIQIMTIHSSKGLEFDIVILPMLSWPIMSFHPEDILWCEPKTAPFNMLPIVAVHPSDKLMLSHLQDDYIQEMIAQYTDYLNLTYVALTRPRYRLYAFGQKYSENKQGKISIQNIGHLLSYLYDTNHELDDQLTYVKMDEGDTKIAPLPPIKEEEENEKEKHTIVSATYVNIPIKDRLILRSRIEDDFEEDVPLSTIDLGTKMHLWLSYIHTWQDAEPSLTRLIREGQVSDQQAIEMRQQLNKLQSLIQQENHTDWYSKQYRILFEQDIITPSGNFYRPDRVILKDNHAIVIDYKFGYTKHKSHLEQVRNYMLLLSQMGYTTEGHIVYNALQTIHTIH
jgi:ATP-dependent exoDNAse (exonuclease V) beta subunit